MCVILPYQSDLISTYINRKHVDIMKYFLEQHADVNKPNKTGVTALHIAASNGFAEPLGILLEFDADVNKQVNHFSVVCSIFIFTFRLLACPM